MKKTLALLLFCLGGCMNPTACPTPPEREVDPFTVDFRVLVMNDPIVLIPGVDTEIIVQVLRHPDFDTPVLLSAFALPEYVSVHSRENREEDIDGITVLVVRTTSLERSGGESPGFYRFPRFVVQGTDGEGTIHPYTAQFTVEYPE